MYVSHTHTHFYKLSVDGSSAKEISIKSRKMHPRKKFIKSLICCITQLLNDCRNAREKLGKEINY